MGRALLACTGTAHCRRVRFAMRRGHLAEQCVLSEMQSATQGRIRTGLPRKRRVRRSASMTLRSDAYAQSTAQRATFRCQRRVDPFSCPGSVFDIQQSLLFGP